jgi:pimeloyl-ACP methyl ester carboxylesterase
MRLFRRHIPVIAIALIAITASIIAIVLGLFAARVRHVSADANAGFHADYYVYVSPGARRLARESRIVTLLVQPNNSGTNSDDPNVHRDDAWWTTFGRSGIADDLNVVLLVPAFIRPATDWRIYTHALDRDALLTERNDLKRLDLQLMAMIDHARTTLAREGMQIDERVLIQGFSASGMFANRFTALHPDRVKAAAVGSPGGWPIAPVATYSGEDLPYPAGVSNVSFDAAAFRDVPQMFVMGALDDNDSLDFRDGWDEEPARQIDRLFGDTPLKRWPRAESLYREAGANAKFMLIDGVGHDRRKLQRHSTDFFREVLQREWR